MMQFTQKRTRTDVGGTRVLTLPDWSTFDSATVLPELEALLAKARAQVVLLLGKDAPTFADLVTEGEELSEQISLVVGTMGHLNNVMQKKYPELQGTEGINTKARALLSAFASEMSMHEGLYRAYLRFRDGAEYGTRSDGERYLIDRAIRDFELAGVGLSPEKKAALQALQEEATKLGSAFSDNDTASTDAWKKHVLTEAEMAGIPPDDRERMAGAAKEAGKEGWLITLQQPDVIAVIKYADVRSLREEVHTAYGAVASELLDGGKYDNTQNMADILRNMDEQARILGYKTYAAMSIVKKMAGSGGENGVRGFIEDLIELARPKAEAEIAVMKEFAATKLGIALEDFAPWDFVYVEEKLKQELHSVDDEAVRQYFPFTKVLEGFATLVKRVFGMTLVETTVNVWKDGVRFLEFYDESGVLRGAIYVDMYAREGKRSGAWMDILIASRKLPDGTMQIPVAYLNCNVSQPSADGEAYMYHSDVETFFHESGHAIHHIFGRTEYSELSMEHVEWDTVELPSQLLENWTWEPRMLALMSAHKVTKGPIPDDLVLRMLGAKHFNTGLFTLRQLVFCYFDWSLYSNYCPANPEPPLALWKKVALGIDVRPMSPKSRFPNSFTHIFGGGYSAGYFSYLWALGLAADGFLAFTESGDIFSREVGERYVTEVLAPGSSRPMAESFRAFRGRTLDPKALAIHLGLITK